MGSQQDVPERVARCACRNLMVTARGEPIGGSTGSEATPDAPSTALSARLAGRLCCSAPKACQELLACPSAALLIRASLDPQSCSGPRNGITGSSFQQASP